MKNSHQTRPHFQTILCPFVIFVLFVVKEWRVTKPETLVIQCHFYYARGTHLEEKT